MNGSLSVRHTEGRVIAHLAHGNVTHGKYSDPVATRVSTIFSALTAASSTCFSRVHHMCSSHEAE